VASEESVRQAQVFIGRLPAGELTLATLVAAHEATFPDDPRDLR
jgi:hypothetical protein